MLSVYLSEALGAGPQVVQFRRRATPPFPDQTRLDKDPEHHKLLCQSPQEPLPVTDITSAYKKKKKKMESLETIRLTSLQQGEWVTSVVFQGYLLPYTIIGTVQEISEISCPGLDTPIQSSAFRSVRSRPGVHCNNKEVKLMAMWKDIKIHQYLDDRLVRAATHHFCLQHTQDLVKICQEIGWLVNLEKSELEPSRSSIL